MALYNAGFPATYQPVVYPQYNPASYPTTPQNQQNNGIIWVQGEAGAKSYLVAPNNTVQLWDSENQVIYLKSADASGMPSMKILDYTIRESAGSTANKPITAQTDNTLYATKGEIDSINGEIAALKKRLEKLMKKEDGDNE